MKNKIKKMGGHVFYIILSNTVYGVTLYFVVTLALKTSELLAYCINLGFIIMGLLLDRWIILKVYQPKKLAEEIRKLEKEKDRALNNRIIKWQLEYFVSFKTSLFFFYIFILLFSQLIKFKPELVGPEINSFINTIDYSVIILLAFKDFSEEFSKDKNRMKEVSEEYDKNMSEIINE